MGEVENELKEVMNKNCPNIDWESWVKPDRIKPKKSTLRHIIIKPLKTKDREEVLKAAREK